MRTGIFKCVQINMKHLLYIQLHGHRNISVLDGGFWKWENSSYEVTADVPAPLVSIKVRKMSKIRKQYNQVPHLTQDVTSESNKNTINNYN